MREPDDNYRFTCGDCHVLARRLARITGWTACSFVEYESDGKMVPVDHAFVKRPDGMFVDIEGAKNEKAFRKHWFGTDAEIFEHPSPRHMAKLWGRPDFGSYSYRRARVVAERLATEHAIT